MKKTKILLPILTGATLASTTPAIVSCANTAQTVLTLENAQAYATAKINGQCSDAMARQPDIAQKIQDACNLCLSVVWRCTNPLQAIGTAFYSSSLDAMARQPEMYGKLHTTIEITSIIILSQPNEKGFALGKPLEKLFDAMARQPEMASQIQAEYIEYAMQVINS